MNFQTYLKENVEDINTKINEALNLWHQDVVLTSPRLLKLADTFIEACQGGKRLRGALVKLGYEIYSDRPNSGILPISAAFEIFQTSILVHDDIVDLSPTRRGKPTLYRRLGGKHYGISQAICLADVGFFLSNKLIVDSRFPDDLKIKAVRDFSQMVINTGLGEILDIELPHLKNTRQETDVITIHQLKTAYYTICYPLRTGAILAGADQSKLEIITKFGENLGIAFQIQDDILGIFGDEEKLGKSVTSDIEEGKNTLLITYVLEHGNQKQKDILSRFYGVGPIQTKELDWIKKAFIESGALDYSHKKALKYVSEAKKLIPKITSDKKYQQLLEEMADFLVERSK